MNIISSNIIERKEYNEFFPLFIMLRESENLFVIVFKKVKSVFLYEKNNIRILFFYSILLSVRFTTIVAPLSKICF